MKDCMRLIRTVWPLAFVVVLGCGDKDADISGVERDVHEVAIRIKNPGPQNMEFGSALGYRIFSMTNTCLRRRCQTEYESAVLSAVFNTPDYDLRTHQFSAFCDFAECCGCGIGAWHGDGLLESLRLRLRILKKMQREWTDAESHRHVDVGFRPGLHASPSSYADMVKQELFSRGERFEKQFNAKNGEMTEDQRSAIRSEFAQIMGRPIRTDEEIKRDRERKNEEARRRQEERLGNDVKVDIDSL